MEQKIRTQIYYVFRTFWFSFVLFLGLTAIFVCIAIELKSPILGTVGFMMGIFLPIIFMRKIKALFTKEALITFEKGDFSISTFRAGKEEEMKCFSCKWDSIRAYKVYFTMSNLTFLDLFLRNGKFKEFAFKEGKTLEESLNGEEPSILKLFLSCVKEFNEQKEKESQILLSPGFLTTKAGTFWLVLIGVLLVIAIILLILIKGSSAAFMLIGFGAYLPLLVKRRIDKSFYKKMSELV